VDLYCDSFDEYNAIMVRNSWTDALDWHAAASNVAEDIKGDWYRDPWGWPEYDYVLDGNLELLTVRAQHRGVKRVAKIDVPKSNFATRPAVILEPIDRLLLQALVDSISRKLIQQLPSWVFGWRRERGNDAPSAYSNNSKEWDGYRTALQHAVSVHDIGLKTDIVSCFASIPVDRACEDVERKAGSNQITMRLIDMLKNFARVQGRSGIPQRSFASCVLANMYLSRLDQVLESYTPPPKKMMGITYARKITTRWMDDVWVFGGDEGRLRSVQLDLQEVAREAGLELNPAKTEVLQGSDLAQAALSLEHSAVDEALAQDTPNAVHLEELVDEIIADPAHADRTSIRFATTRMRRHAIKTRLRALIDTANRLPQGADHLARLFRDFDSWEELQDWFLNYEAGDWGKIRWSVSQFGTMFPTGAIVDRRLVDRFAEILVSRPTLPLLALTAQRLASWDSSLARDSLRALAETADHPLERRLIGLSSLAARDESVFIRNMLSEYEENQITLARVEANRFRPIVPVPDFATNS